MVAFFATAPARFRSNMYTNLCWKIPPTKNPSILYISKQTLVKQSYTNTAIHIKFTGLSNEMPS